MTPTTVSYYTDEVARGLEDYYAGRGEAEGRWLGSGSDAEGLHGTVAAEELARLFDGRHPRSGEPLGAGYVVRDGADRVTGWDLTFSAPKSVSALWAVGGGQVGLEVREAHDTAVAAALHSLEDHAAFSRTGKAGVRQVDTQGLVAAGFVHRSSRAGDPQLHTHVLVSGRVRCAADGAWRALDSRALHRQLKPAGLVYQAALRAELTTRVRVAWTEVDRNGQAEVLGVPDGLRRLFSQRRAAVEVRAGERIAETEVAVGRSLTLEERRRAFEVAVLETRPAKAHDRETDVGLQDRWVGEADAAGHAPVSWLGDTVNRRRPPSPELPAVVEEVVAQLAAATSTWRRCDVVQQLARRAPVDLSAEEVRRWVEHAADQVLAHRTVVALTAPEPEAPGELRRRDGGSVFDRHGATRYTTLTTLAAEQQVIDLAETGRGAGRGVATPRAVEAAIVAAGLGGDQAAGVRTLTTDGDGIVCLVGPAGTGKSRTMGAAADAWRCSGVPVRGLAVSAVAAGVLAQEAGIPSDTIAKLFYEHDRPGDPDQHWRLRPGEVVVVDEAGMVTSRDLARLARLAEQAQAKLVLVGDHAQLGAVGAGGLFRLLADTRSVDLATVRRFTHAWEADASLRLRDRHPDVLAVYEARGRITGSDRLGAQNAAFRAWDDARRAGESVVVCATDNATVDTLARRVRAARVADGHVEPHGTITAGGQTVGVGDEIVTLRNDRRLMTTAGGWVRNGDRWAVTVRHDDGSLTVSHTAGRGRTVLPAHYVVDHVVLAYALTLHKAQGVTVDRAVLIADDRTTAEALYVGMTRGRRHNRALVICDHLDPEHHHDTPPAAVDVLTGALARVSAEQAALDTLRRTLAASESLAVLAPRLANLDAWIRRETPPDHTVDLERLATRRAGVEQHARPGRLTRARREDRRLLDGLDARRHELEAAQAHRQAWLEEHADTLVYRDELAAQAAARRTGLGTAAAVTQPDHLIDLLGPVPGEAAERNRWVTLAGRVEAYREQWGIAPDDLLHPPVDGVQYRQWDTAVNTIQIINRLEARRLQPPSIERGVGIEL